MKSKVFKMAWDFVKENGMTMAAALRKAWANVKLVMRMQKGIVKFTFKKIDGTIRKAQGTLLASLIPPTKGGKSSKGVQVYYDIDKQQYRCFKRVSLIG